MTRRKRNGNGNGTKNWGFNFATVVQVFAIPLLSAIIYLIVQWVVQGDTLKHHEADIIQNQKDIKEEAVAREKNRTDFLDKLGKLNDGLGQLNTNLAVQGQVLNSINDELHRGGNKR